MVKHTVEITVPATSANRELVVNVEVFSIANNFPMGDVDGVHRSAIGKLISSFAEGDTYRATVEKTAIARSKGTENMQYGYFIPGEVIW